MNMQQHSYAISRNPTSGEFIEAYPYDTPEALETSLTRAITAYSAWKKTPVQQRCEALKRLGVLPLTEN